MMKKIILLLIVASLGLLMVGCQGCKEPVKDPCEGVEEVVAGFKMEYFMGWNEDQKWFAADTVLERARVRFSAIGLYDSIKWKVGLDPRTFTAEEFTLEFDNAASVEVRLIGYRAPNSDCFPDDDGVDTVYRQLVIVPKKESLIFGEFEGYFLSEPDSLFTMKLERDTTSPPFEWVWVPEFPKGCVKGTPTDGFDRGGIVWYSYRRLYNYPNGLPYGSCQGSLPYMDGEYRNDTLRVYYKYLDGSGEGTFIGTKK